ncbi:class C beta-lactamase [Undibacterium sp. SXout7W]|uniref:class C beta-lactamase n=1 Tax=Undibacterium sp. SXout7W TaxID=3413049 RepID=UPI003BF15BAC
MARRVTLAITTAYVVSHPALAADDSTPIRNIVDAVIPSLMNKNNVPGMAVAVSIGGRTLFFNYGVASKEKNIPVTEATIFELGSISKTLTATLASYAQVIGKLALDDHPGRYIPQLKGSAIDQVSLLNLATFTAGELPLQFPDDIGNDEVINYFQQWTPKTAAGTQRKYSNPSIGLFGYITGIALGRDFASAMETILFLGLGLQHSYIHVPTNEMPNYAWGYDKKNNAIRVQPGVFDAETYGIKSTSADMIRFVQMNMDPTSLPKPMQGAINGTHTAYFMVGEMIQGLGWEQFPYPVTLERLLSGNSEKMIFESNAAKKITPSHALSRTRLFDKTGSTNGFGSYVAFVPEKQIGIVMLANKNYPIPERIKAAHAILKQIEFMTPSFPVKR